MALVALLLLAPAITTQAQFAYDTQNGVVTITGYVGSGGSVTIPASINGLPVTSIGGNAFFSQTNVTALIVPDSVTNIGAVAFLGCRNLSHVALGHGVSSIGDYAFCATDLTGVAIPESVQSIGIEAFQCFSLTAISVDPANPFYSSSNGVLFDKAQTTLVEYPSGLIGGCTIPDGVTSIGADAFAACTNLTSVTIGNSVTNIGEDAFAGTALASVTIPSSVVTIGAEAYRFATLLTNVTFGAGVASIGEGAFEYTALSSVTIPDSVFNIGDLAFYGCAPLAGVVIGNGVTNIGDQALSQCPALAVITVGQGNSAYSSLGGVLFDKNQKRLLQHPLDQTRTNYVIPAGVTNIAIEAFEKDTNLTGVTIPDSVISIDDDAFANTALESVTIPDSVTQIGEFAFSGCSNLVSAMIGDSVTNIGEGAFYDCYGLTSVFFAGDAPAADSSTFYSDEIGGDDSMAMIYYLGDTVGWSNTFATLPAVALDMPPQFGSTDDSFEYMKVDGRITITRYLGVVAALTIPGMIDGLPVASIRDYAFFEAPLTSVIIPQGMVSIGNGAFKGAGLVSVGVPGSVTNIGAYAFSSATLRNVFFGGPPPSLVMTLLPTMFIMVSRRLTPRQPIIYPMPSAGATPSPACRPWSYARRLSSAQRMMAWST